MAAHRFQRHSLKSKEAKTILREVSERLKIDLEESFDHKVNVEIVEADTGQIILVNRKPLLFRSDGQVFPTLFFKEFMERVPKIVVDMGAVPYVCKGADIMAPGVVRIEGEFGKGDFVVVVDINHQKPLALGESICDSDNARATKKGALAKNVHYVSDKIWDLAKATML